MDALPRTPDRVGFQRAAGRDLEYHWYDAGGHRLPPIVLLHEGLGSVAMWKDFPAKLAAATGAGVLAYSRYGYGQSSPLAAPHRSDYMHREAMQSLPELLDGLGIYAPVLAGHSDGGSIAIIHAGGHHRPVAGLILMAAHVFNEDVSVASITQAKQAFATTGLKEKLGRYHADPEGAFRGWNDAWLAPDFLDWNLEKYLPAITCPVLAIQGVDDQYGTPKQIHAIAAGIGGHCQTMLLDNCGHAAHRDQEETTLAAMAGFVKSL